MTIRNKHSITLADTTTFGVEFKSTKNLPPNRLIDSLKPQGKRKNKCGKSSLTGGLVFGGAKPMIES
jgi:hypothetical protein